MGVRLYNVECKFCGLNHDLIFSGESTPNYGVFIMNTDLLAQNSCPRCHRTDSQIPSKAHELVGEALEKSRQPNSESAISDVLEAVRIAPNSSYIIIRQVTCSPFAAILTIHLNMHCWQ